MSETTEPKEDLTYGEDVSEDVRGDHALFIERKHIKDWDLDEEAQAFTENLSPTFFRVIKDGEQQSGHGWIEGGKIIQWG